jgi:hypothetical protein
MQFAPAVYEHCARLIDRRPWEVSRDPDLLFEGQAEAYRRYRHAPVVVGVDIYNLEAEAYGARVDEPDGNGIPAIVDHPFAASADLLALPPLNPVRDGRLPMVLAVGERLRDAMPEADVRIPVAGPFSVASNLVGLNALLCDVLTDPGLVRRPAASRRRSGECVPSHPGARTRYCVFRVGRRAAAFVAGAV